MGRLASHALVANALCALLSACTAAPLDPTGRCPQPTTPCPARDPTAPPRCVDLDEDPEHCGACGARCPDEQRCLLGACEPARCTASETRCADAYTVRRCAPSGLTYRDEPCPLDRVCQSGSCRGFPTRWSPVRTDLFTQPTLGIDWFATDGLTPSPCVRRPPEAPCATPTQRPERVDGRSAWALRNHSNHLRTVAAMPARTPLALSMTLRFPSPASSVEIHLRGTPRCFDSTSGSAFVLRAHENLLQFVTPGGGELARRTLDPAHWYTLRLEEDPLLGEYRLLLDGSLLRAGLLSDYPARGVWNGIRSTGACDTPQLYLEQFVVEEGS